MSALGPESDIGCMDLGLTEDWSVRGVVLDGLTLVSAAVGSSTKLLKFDVSWSSEFR